MISTATRTFVGAPHIVHISTVHPPFDQRIYHRECVSACKSGYNVVLLVNASSDQQREGVCIKSLGNVTRDTPRLNLLGRWKRARNACSMAATLDSKLYHFHDPELIPAAIALKRKTRRAVIYDCHEDNVGFMLQKAHIPWPLRRAMALATLWMERQAARSLDLVITADPGVCARFRKWGARTEVLYNFPRLDLFPREIPRAPARYDLVYHGSIPKYHVEACLRIDSELIKQGRRARWLLFGRFHDLKWAREQVKLAGAQDRFEMFGPMAHEAVASQVLQANIGIIPLPNLPKFKFNIPTKLFEFMALRMPVVLSDLQASQPFVADRACALPVPAGDFPAYARAINILLENETLRERMGREGRRRVETELNWDRESAKLATLYANLLQGN